LEPFKEKEFLILNNEIFNKVLDILKDLAYQKFEQLSKELSTKTNNTDSTNDINTN